MLYPKMHFLLKFLEKLNLRDTRISDLSALEQLENLKELNEVMQANAAKFDYPFVGRLEMVVPDELHNVSSVIYPIIEILTDGNAVKLTGFMED